MTNHSNTEFETKVTDIDPVEVIQRLRELVAKETPEFLMQRYVFDIKSDDIEWIRLRTNGTVTTIAYKHKYHENKEVGRTTEIEVEVADFEKAAEIFKQLKWHRVFYQENKSHIFRLNDIEFSIDSWPYIDPYLEVEANSKEKVDEGLKLLGLTGKDRGDIDIGYIYDEKDIDIHSFAELKFENN